MAGTFTFEMPAVHPHGCGENYRNGTWRCWNDGPSPRVWGKRPEDVERWAADGPSPRVWGKRCRGVSAPWQQRSSPRVWGKPSVYDVLATLCRSIPTGVGKTRCCVRQERGHTVHPHGCGENFNKALASPRPSGPSPRVWGKLQQSASITKTERSIPTGVGKTVQPGSADDTERSIPTGVGKTVPYSRLLLCLSPAGPSPRVWGKHKTQASEM